MILKDPKIYEIDETDFNHNGVALLDFVEEPIINRVLNGRYFFSGVYDIEGQHAEMIKKDAIIKAYCPDGSWQKFRITSPPKKTLNTLTFVANKYEFDANRNFIESMFVSHGTVNTIMEAMESSLAFNQVFKYSSDISSSHQFTIKQNYPVDALIGSNNNAQNLASVVGGELDMIDDKIIMRKRLGEDRGFVIDLGLNLDYIEEDSPDTECPNSLFLVGAQPEGDYDEEKDAITLSYVEPKDMEVTDENRVIGKYTNSECHTEQELLAWAENDLFGKRQVHIPRVSHKVSIIDLSSTEEYKEYKDLFTLQIGDSLHGKLQKQNITISERMIEYNFLTRQAMYKDMILGNDPGMYSKTIASAINNSFKKTEEAKDLFYDEIINATNVITGNDGGHIVLWPKNRPTDILIMDTPDIETAKHVLRMNKSGIGFSKDGFSPEKFGTAWTIDGVFYADYILAGVLRAISIIGVDITGSTITGTNIFGSVFETINTENIKMNLSNGSINFLEGKEGGRGVGGIYMHKRDRLNPWMLLQTNFEDTTSASIFMSDEATGINNNVLVSLLSVGKIYLGAPKIDLVGDVEITGSLKINGVTVTPGQGGGGGGWNGTYPPSVTSSADKFAWQAWASLRGKGYSEAAAAGILGNIQGEVGSGMNPNTSQIGGPAYGAVQWDGSAYPLVGSPTWDGREYVQRLMAAAGITLDYTTMVAQMELVEWCMFNGQWIGQVAPTSVAAFKSATSPATAAYSFELNFERPAAAHPERQGYAQAWYDKFSGLSISQGYIAPIDNPITITSEFGWRTSPITGQQELHNGIDLVGGTGSNTNIYASGAGEVIYAGWENSYGNYVVIRHADGLYTGYAHNSALSVSVGQNVTRGQKIANMGTTGDSTGPHCHFQFFTGGLWPTSDKFINPREHVNF